ncbi:MAG: YqaE/Pmp3 family membrane protein [bacterium]|nr:YqaE/Pmp3 family membrane protein [bacterium]
MARRVRSAATRASTQPRRSQAALNHKRGAPRYPDRHGFHASESADGRRRLHPAAARGGHQGGFGTSLLINIILTLLFWVPGLIHAIIVVLR